MDFALPGMDTKTLSDEGVAMPIKDIKTGLPLNGADGQPVTITVLGPDSKANRMAARAAVRKRLRSMTIAETVGANEGAAFDAEEAESIDMLASITVGWTGICTTKKEPIPCTKETAAELYRAFPAVRDQVDAFVASRLNFIKA